MDGDGYRGKDTRPHTCQAEKPVYGRSLLGPTVYEICGVESCVPPLSTQATSSPVY
jgi:hypothetical protein